VEIKNKINSADNANQIFHGFMSFVKVWLSNAMNRHITANHKTASMQKLACFSTAKFIVQLRGTHYGVKMRTAIVISLDDVLWTAFDGDSAACKKPHDSRIKICILFRCYLKIHELHLLFSLSYSFFLNLFVL